MKEREREIGGRGRQGGEGERETESETETEREKGSSPQFQGKLLYTAKKLPMYRRQTFLWEKRRGFTNDSACLEMPNYLISTCS